jgi:uncharacterized protein (DUF488 family)
MELYTLGHSRHPAETFIRLLQEKDIALLVDVRSTPYSRFNPHFNKRRLEERCTQHGIEYAFLGEALGGRPADPTCYRKGSTPGGGEGAPRVDYAEVMRRPWFQQGIARLLELARARRTAILCSEEDPRRCHRQHLIAAYLLAGHPEVEILHIRGDGSTVNARELAGPE